MNQKELKTSYWRKVVKSVKPTIYYDKEIDTLFFYFSNEEKDRIITHFVDENVAFLYRRSDREIVGIRIEYFEKTFLPKVAKNREWRFSATGSEIIGIKDVTFAVEAIDSKPPKEKCYVPEPLDQRICINPEFILSPA